MRALAPKESGPRARYREQTRGEIKDIALRQLADGGIAAIALTRIAKELGLSGPALYRYFPSRDELLSALIRDAYDDAATAVREADAEAAQRSPRAHLHALAAAYRAWAVGQPHRYLLIAGSPLPGFSAPDDTVGRARAVLGPFLAVFALGTASPAARPLAGQLARWAGDEPGVAAWLAEDGGVPERAGATGPALAGAVTAWARLHGTVSLEATGQFGGMGFDPGALFEAEVDSLADAFGLA